MITQVGTATSADSGGSGVSSLTLAFPTGWAANDVAYAVVGNANSNATGHAVSSETWDNISGDVSAGGSTNLVVLRRVLQSGDDTTPTVAWSGGSSRSVGGIVALRGVDTSDPEDDVQSGTFTDTSSSIVAPAVNAVLLNDLVISAFLNSSSRTGTPPGSQDELFDIASGSNTPHLQFNIDKAVLSATGSSGTRTETLSGTSNQRIGISVAVRPAPVTEFEGWGVPL